MLSETVTGTGADNAAWRAIADAGFRPETARHDLEFPAWVPMPVSEVVIGRAVKPA